MDVVGRGFTQVRPGCCRVHSGWLGSGGCALGVVGFMRDRWVHDGASWGSSGSFGCSLGHSGVPWGWSGSLVVVGFTRLRPVGRRVHSGSLGSLGYVLGVVSAIRGRWVDSDGPWGFSG